MSTEVQIRIIETVIVLVIYLVIKVFTYKSVEKTIVANLVAKSRGKVIRKIINLITLIISVIVISLIWGVKQSELLVFITSVLTVLGIALFAQWSMLSNITSGLIIFFGHPVRLEDVVVVIDKDYEIEGRVSNISLFFVTIKTLGNEQDNNKPITIPNNVFLQKMVKIKGQASQI